MLTLSRDTLTLLEAELRGSFDFYHRYTNLDPASDGYGLTVDSTKKPEMASIASSGFALSAWVIAAERGYLPHAEARDIVRRSLDTLLHRVSHHRGFFAHFLDISSGQRRGKTEYSTIDSALCLNGVITAAAYFDDAEIADLAEALLARVEWDFIVFEEGDTTLFHMAYNPDRGGDYVEGRPGFISRWDMAAEQRMLYFQAATRLDPAVARALYAGWRRDIGLFDGQPIIVSPGGALFIHQYTEAWFDSARYLDPDGIDWFENSRRATLANRAFCMAHAAEFPSYSANSWGASAGDSPWGYDVSGATPAPYAPDANGTVSIWGALSSLPFTPDETLAMMHHLRETQPQCWGPYGFYDAYNLAVSPPWFSRDLYGINKGCSMIMIENVLSGLIWDTYTNSPTIQRALAILGFTERAT